MKGFSLRENLSQNQECGHFPGALDKYSKLSHMILEEKCYAQLNLQGPNSSTSRMTTLMVDKPFHQWDVVETVHNVIQRTYGEDVECFY